MYTLFFFFLMIRRPPRSTLDRSSAASDVYKRQIYAIQGYDTAILAASIRTSKQIVDAAKAGADVVLSLIHISEPTRPY